MDRDDTADQYCADCSTKIGEDDGPKDGWQLDDGRTVCNQCSADDLVGFGRMVIAVRKTIIH